MIKENRKCGGRQGTTEKGTGRFGKEKKSEKDTQCLCFGFVGGASGKSRLNLKGQQRSDCCDKRPGKKMHPELTKPEKNPLYYFNGEKAKAPNVRLQHEAFDGFLREGREGEGPFIVKVVFSHIPQQYCLASNAGFISTDLVVMK